MERSILNNIISNDSSIKQGTLKDLFNRFKDQLLSMLEWYDILTARYGVCSINALYTILQYSIEYYDKSIEVNSFYYKDNLYWLDKNTRIGLQHLIDCGAENITLQLDNNLYINISSDKLALFLKNLEIYAAKCFTVTAKHKQDIIKLTSLSEIRDYDFTTEYPDKLTLDEN